MGRLNRFDFTKWAKEQVGSAYLWGGQGESLYELIENLAAKKEQSDANTDKMLDFIKRKGIPDLHFFDCSGLSVDYLLRNKALAYDTTAAGLYRLCDPIKESEVVEGDWAFLKDSDGDIYHIGYVVDNNEIVHAFSQSDGVIQEKRSKRNWFYARPNFAFDFSDLEKKKEETVEVKEYVVNSGDTLWKIANKYGTTVNAIVSANKEKYPKITPSFIRVGWRLVIPK